MRKWLYDRPWIWVVLFLAALVAGSFATLIIAEINKPEIVRPKEPRHHRSGPTSSVGPWQSLSEPSAVTHELA